MVEHCNVELSENKNGFVS